MPVAQATASVWRGWIANRIAPVVAGQRGRPICEQDFKDEAGGQPVNEEIGCMIGEGVERGA